MTPKLPIVITCSLLGLTAPVGFTFAQSDSPSVITHPINKTVLTQPESPKMQKWDADRWNAYLSQADAYYNAPVSVLSQNATDTIYTRKVNRFTCHAIVGDVEWLGTRSGIKCIDHKRQVVRLYGPSAGLPGYHVVDINADSKGVVALLRSSNETFSVYYWDASKNRWFRLTDVAWTFPGQSYDASINRGQAVQPLICLTPTTVVLALPNVEKQTEHVVTLWSRDNRSKRHIPWDQAMRNDQPFLRINALVNRGETLYLGSQLGLLTVNTTGKPLWGRQLPDLTVDSIVPAAGDVLYLSATAHEYTANWQPLLRYHLKDGKREALPHIQPGSTWSQLESRGTLALDEQNTLWLVTPEAFAHLQANDMWVILNDEGKPMGGASPSFSGFQFGRDILPASLPVPPATTIPRRIATERVLVGTPPLEYPTYGTFRGWRETAWVRTRFPEWLSPPAKLPTTATKALWPLSPIVEDPVDPSVVWTVQGRDLVRLPRRAVGSALPDNALTKLTSIYLHPQTTFPDAMHFPIVGGTTSLHPQIQKILTNIPQTNPSTLLVHANDGIFLVDTATNAWLPVPIAVENGPPANAQGGKLVRAGKDSTIYFEFWQNKKILQYDPAQKKFIDSPVDRGPSNLLEGTPAGIWETAYQVEHQGESTIQRPTNDLRLIAANGEARTISPFTNQPTGVTINQQQTFAITGSTLWYQGQRKRTDTERYPQPNDSYPVVVGYDTNKNTWTPPLEYPPFYYQRPEIVAQDNVTYALFNAPDGVVWQLDGEQWKAIAPRLPIVSVDDNENRYSSLRLTTMTAQEVWLVDNRSLCGFDRTTNRWTRYPLPKEFTPPLTSDFPARSAVASTPTAILLGSDKGLWKFDREERRWSELSPTVTIGSPSSGDNGIHPSLQLTSLAVDNDSVYLTGTFGSGYQGILARFDKSTKAVTFLSEADTGISPAMNSPRVRMAGEELWYWNSENTYHRPKGTVNFNRIPTLANEIVPDPTDAKTVYLVSANSLQRFNTQTGVRDTVAEATQLKPQDPNNRSWYPPVFYNGLATPSAVWLSGSNGIYRWDKQTGKLSSAGMVTLSSPRFGSGEDGSLWFNDEDTILHHTRDDAPK